MSAQCLALRVSAVSAFVCVFGACETKPPINDGPGARLQALPIEIMRSEPSFVAKVIGVHIATVPSQDGSQAIDFFAIEVERDNGDRFAITALPATPLDVNAARQLTRGKSYRFPDAMQIQPDKK